MVRVTGESTEKELDLSVIGMLFNIISDIAKNNLKINVRKNHEKNNKNSD